MTYKPDEMEAEAEAILRVLGLAKSQRATRASAEYDEARVKSAAARLKDGARVLRARSENNLEAE
jgi:hypothetical protein